MKGSPSDLLQSLRQMQDRRDGKSVPPEYADIDSDSPGQPDRVAAFDFSQLDGFQEMRLQRAAAAIADLSSPFFREHAQVDGVRSVIDGRTRLNFASYDYLGLNAHPRVREAAAQAARTWGVSATASRLVGGERPYHGALETDLARFMGTQSALVMTSGHATNVTTVGALVGSRDLVLTDAFIHNSITEGCRLASATRVVFPHNDFDWLDDYLAQNRSRYRRVLIVVEGLYSMDGDIPDLARLVEIKSRHAAWLMVDEAHALGVLGETGRGIAEHAGVDPASVEVWMGTLSKTLASCGGFIAGSANLIDYLKYKAPGFVFSVGLSSPAAEAARVALGVLEAEPQRVQKLRQNGLYFLDRALGAGLNCGHAQGYAITPIIAGGSLKAVSVAQSLLERDINALPIIFPAVPEKTARLRFFLTSEHDRASIDAAIDAMASI